MIEPPDADAHPVPGDDAAVGPDPEAPSPPSIPDAEADLESRRSFVKKIGIVAGAGAIGAAIAGPAFKYLAGTGLESGADQEWVQLALASSVPIGEPTLLKSSVERTAGWITTRSELSAYVLTEDGEQFTAFSNVCTHLGCRVRWVDDQGGFFCPCHNAVFGRDGSVQSGPPPSPLEQYEVMVEEGQLMIKEA